MPKCGDNEKLVLSNSRTMDWRRFSIAQSDLPAAIEDHKAELREMEATKLAETPEPPSGGTYAAAKMRS